MNKTALEIKQLLFIGGNIIIDANDYTILQMKNFAFVAKSKGASVTIRNAHILNSMQCKAIAFINPTGIIFDFSKQNDNQ